MKIAIVILVLLTSTVAHAEECPLSGYWRSHEGKTLESLSAAEEITDEQAAFYSRNFFGRQHVYIECHQFTSVLDEWEDVQPYTFVTEGDQFYLTYFSEFEGDVKRPVLIEDDCYAVPVHEGQFWEYFCPVSAEAYSDYRFEDYQATLY